MDKTIKGLSGKRKDVGAGPVVVLADWYQFGPGERAVRPCVESRMFLWCEHGKGKLCINGVTSPFPPGGWVLLPWRHSLVYEAGPQDPFLVGGIHIIPRHDATLPAMFRVAHRKDDPLAGHKSRRDAVWPSLEGVVRGAFGDTAHPLLLLARYILERFQHATPERPLMSRLALILIEELTRAVQEHARHSELLALSPLLRRVQGYARTHMQLPLSIESFATAGGCSEASIYRAFREHLHTSPGRWLARLRAERAAMLLRTTTLPVREIGERVGFSDPFHFSRLFKRQMGVSPRAYRDSRLML